jgi:carbon-monoxide dehydrogenase medium subunit
MSDGTVARYVRPADLAALIAIAEGPADTIRFLAGGQSLVPALLANPVPPVTLLDVSRIPELRTLSIGEAELWIGAAVTFTEILESGISSALPVLAEALRHVGTVTIRNRATVGGSLGWTDPRGELLLVMLVHDAVIHTSRRTIAPSDFASGPFRSVLDPDELIVGISITIDRDARRGFAELIDRNSAGKAIVAVAVAAWHGAGRGVRVAVGGVADRAVASPPIDAIDAVGWIDELAQSMPALDDPFHSIAYRRAMAATLVRRVIRGLPA